MVSILQLVPVPFCVFRSPGFSQDITQIFHESTACLAKIHAELRNFFIPNQALFNQDNNLKNDVYFSAPSLPILIF